jgi:hypothetical protein
LSGVPFSVAFAVRARHWRFLISVLFLIALFARKENRPLVCQRPVVLAD